MISNKGVIIFISLLELLLIKLISFITGTLPSFIYLVKFFVKRFSILLFLISLLFQLLDNFTQFFDFLLDSWKICYDFLFLFISDKKFFINGLTFTYEFDRCLDKFDLSNELSLFTRIKSLGFHSSLNLLNCF